jgi:hypothetical protein
MGLAKSVYTTATHKANAQNAALRMGAVGNPADFAHFSPLLNI